MGHTDVVYSVAWSADGRLASSSYDENVILWDLKTGQPAQTHMGHNGYAGDIMSIAWSAERGLAWSSGNSIVIAREYLITNPCEWMIRNMTIQEWLVLQGVLFSYQPSCSNLYDPSEELNLIEDINSRDVFAAFVYLLITWKGRALAFVLLLTLLGIIFFIVYKSGKWVWRKLTSRRKAFL